MGAGLIAYASRSHYLDHIAPVWSALGSPEPLRLARDLIPSAEARDLPCVPLRGGRGPMLVGGYSDLWKARRMGYGPFVLMQHGAGQSYGGDPRSDASPYYAGGRDHHDVALFLVPGPHPAERWRSRYPATPVVMIGEVKPLPERAGDIDEVPAREWAPTVAFTFHWPCGTIPEMGTAWRDFRDALPAIAERWPVIGHWHPRWGDHLRRWYEEHRIEPVASLEEVARRADVLVADNTSALFEFAATDRPVVVLNGSRFRRLVHHGLRYWEASTVGIACDRPESLMGAIRLALLDPTGLRVSRRDAIAMVYRGGGVPAAVEAIAAM